MPRGDSVNPKVLMTALKEADGCALTARAKGILFFQQFSRFVSAADCSSNLSPKQLSVLQVPTDPRPHKKQREDTDHLYNTAEKIRSFFISWLLVVLLFGFASVCVLLKNI